MGSTISATEVAPNAGKKFIFFSTTLDGSAQADFSAYSSVDLIQAWDATTPGATAEPVTAIVNGGDVTFTNASNAIVGWAFVTE